MQFELTISNKQAEVTHLLTFLKRFIALYNGIACIETQSDFEDLEKPNEKINGIRFMKRDGYVLATVRGAKSLIRRRIFTLESYRNSDSVAIVEFFKSLTRKDTR